MGQDPNLKCKTPTCYVILYRYMEIKTEPQIKSTWRILPGQTELLKHRISPSTEIEDCNNPLHQVHYPTQGR